MMITHKLEMDLLQRQKMQRIDVVQGDRNSRQLELTLFSGGEPWKIPETAAVNLRFCKADGTGGRYRQWPEGTDCWSIRENVLTILLAPAVTDAEGMVFAQIELEQEGKELATFSLQIYVERNVAAGVLGLGNYVDRPQWMTKQLEKWLLEAQDDKKIIPVRYGDTPFRLYDLPLQESQNRYEMDKEGNPAVLDRLGKFSPVVRCPRYLGWLLKPGAQVYLYIGDMINGEFKLDPKYIFYIHKTSQGVMLPNFLQEAQNRFITVEEGKYFCYRISKGEGDDVTIVGCDNFPKTETEAIGYVPDCVSAGGSHLKDGKNYGIVLPAGCHYAVLAEDSENYDRKDFNVTVLREAGVERISKGVSFGRTGETGVTLLTVPGGCRPENLTVYLSKEVKGVAAAGRMRRARELGRKLIRDFNFVSKVPIRWNDSNLPLQEGKWFAGVPYASRWVNSHFVGFEVSVETALNALNDPYSIAYDGGLVEVEENGEVRVEKWNVSGNTEIYWDPEKPLLGGGTGYGLVCAVFANLIFGNGYPQTNRGFTFDKNFTITPMTTLMPGTVAMNADMTHCVMVDEVYEDGYSLMEATDPCVAKTVHTSDVTVSGALDGKTRKRFLDSYVYTVTNIDSSGYSSGLADFENIEIPGGVLRPWRGHKSVYGPWDRFGKVGNYRGSGIGLTVHPTEEQVETNEIPLKIVFIPSDPAEPMVNLIETTVAADQRYLDISDLVNRSGEYIVSGGDGKEERFRYYDHAPVVLDFNEEAGAVFRYEDGTLAEDVLYAYIRVMGYGGDWGKNRAKETEPTAMVVAAGQCYPDLAADMGRIRQVYAAIVADPESDSWGKYSCLCAKGGNR